MNYQETEIKLPILDLAAALRLVEALGARTAKPRHFEDNWIFDHEAHVLRNHGMLLRLRIIDDNSDQGILTFKGRPEISDGVKNREELECEIHGTKNFVQTLSKLGFSAMFRYQKYRTVFQ